jgi:hypothetical protein
MAVWDSELACGYVPPTNPAPFAGRAARILSSESVEYRSFLNLEIPHGLELSHLIERRNRRIRMQPIEVLLETVRQP